MIEGLPFTITIAALDAQGRPLTSFVGPVTFSSDDPRAVLGAAVTANSVIGQERIGAMAAGAAAATGDPSMGQTQALGQFAGVIQQQALVITYSECFWGLGVLLMSLAAARLFGRFHGGDRPG